MNMQPNFKANNAAHRRFHGLFGVLTAAMCCLMLPGCGGVRTYLHNIDSSVKHLEAVSLRTGERRLAITDKDGIMIGGYFWGLIAEDPAIVAIEYEERGRTTRTFLTGSFPGVTRVYYINRIGFTDPGRSIGSYGESGNYIRESSHYFDVIVR
jgi:hypothetical protein